MRILLPFFDDSSLLFAAKMRGLLGETGVRVETAHQKDSFERGAISDRQLRLSLPGGPDHLADDAFWKPNGAITAYDAIITGRSIRHADFLLANPLYRLRRKRPCFVAFWPGLELSPERGIWNRRRYDVIFANKEPHVKLFHSSVRTRNWQYVSYGHPYFLKPKAWLGDDPSRRNIYFFTQSIAPPTRIARLHVLRVLVAVATANPDRTVWVKLRHLPNENKIHVHKEQFSYPDLLAELPAPPANLRFTACSMQEALADAAICLTCSSTAAMDAISAGIPTMVYLDYVEHYLDRYAPPTRREFASSGLIASLEDVLHLRTRPPAQEWLDDRFRGEDFLHEMLDAIAQFRERRPFSQPVAWAERRLAPAESHVKGDAGSCNNSPAVSGT